MERLDIEITESMIENLGHARATIEDLRARGVPVLIDDFGIGSSNSVISSKLSAARLELDRTFIAGMLTLTYRHDRLITESVIRLARELKHDVVAEGVEDIEHERWLRARGVQGLQGFLYSPAVGCRALAAMLRGQPFAYPAAVKPQRPSAVGARRKKVTLNAGRRCAWGVRAAPRGRRRQYHAASQGLARADDFSGFPVRTDQPAPGASRQGARHLRRR